LDLQTKPEIFHVTTAGNLQRISGSGFMNTDQLIQVAESFVLDIAGFGQPHHTLYTP